MQLLDRSAASTAETDPIPGRVVTDARVYPAENGYEFISNNELAGWQPVADWGRDGWDLGHWPTHIVMVSNETAHPRALVYREGNVEVREFESESERTAFLDHTAEWNWRHGVGRGPGDVGAYSVGSLPQTYYGAPSTGALGPGVTPAAPVEVAGPVRGPAF